MSGLNFFKLNKKLKSLEKSFLFYLFDIPGTFSTPLEFRQRLISVSGFFTSDVRSVHLCYLISNLICDARLHLHHVRMNYLGSNR